MNKMMVLIFEIAMQSFINKTQQKLKAIIQENFSKESNKIFEKYKGL